MSIKRRRYGSKRRRGYGRRELPFADDCVKGAVGCSYSSAGVRCWALPCPDYPSSTAAVGYEELTGAVAELLLEWLEQGHVGTLVERCRLGCPSVREWALDRSGRRGRTLVLRVPGRTRAIKLARVGDHTVWRWLVHAAKSLRWNVRGEFHGG